MSAAVDTSDRARILAAIEGFPKNPGIPGSLAMLYSVGLLQRATDFLADAPDRRSRPVGVETLDALEELLISALLVVSLRNIFHAVLALVVSFVGVAGVFLTLNTIVIVVLIRAADLPTPMFCAA